MLPERRTLKLLSLFRKQRLGSERVTLHGEDSYGNLITVMVDDHGRLQAILTDPEDIFGHPAYVSVGELAARLGSINTYERRGNVVWMDDFEDAPLKWRTDTQGAGAAVARDTASAYRKGHSLKLTTGNATDDYAGVIHDSYVPHTTKLGWECAFALGSVIKTFDIGASIKDGADAYLAYLRYAASLDKLQIRTGVGTYTDIATSVVLFEEDIGYHIWKLVIDWDTKYYLRAYLDGVEYDISAYQIPSFTQVVTPRMETSIYAYSPANANRYVYVDDFILTQNEP